MEIHKDFKEFIELFNSHGVEYVFFISKNDFIKNKKSISRHKDLADIETLALVTK